MLYFEKYLITKVIAFCNVYKRKGINKRQLHSKLDTFQNIIFHTNNLISFFNSKILFINFNVSLQH